MRFRNDDVSSLSHTKCDYKGAKSVEANACPDHIHMLVKIPQK